MKKYIITSIVAIVALVASVNVYQSHNRIALVDLALANVEALANNEDDDKDEKKCYKSVTEAPDDNTLAVSARKCSDCKLYWSTSASDSSKCKN